MIPAVFFMSSKITNEKGIFIYNCEASNNLTENYTWHVYRSCLYVNLTNRNAQANSSATNHFPTAIPKINKMFLVFYMLHLTFYVTFKKRLLLWVNIYFLQNNMSAYFKYQFYNESS